MKPFTVISIVLVLIFGGTSGCVKREQPVDPPNTSQTSIQQTPIVKLVESASHTNDDTKPTESQAIDAIRRAHPHSLQVCHDSVNDGFMIQYRVRDDDEPEDKWMHGWWWIKNEKFWKASNGTWFTQKRIDSDYVQIYPDPFNLPCKKTQ